MAIIQSGATADTLTIDAASKAARVTLYQSDGSQGLDPLPTGSYILPINLKQTAAVAAGSAIWTMRNTGSLKAYIRRISLIMGCDVATATAATYRYELIRFSAATPTGGTQLTPVKKRTSYGNPSVTDARFNEAAALTVTGVTFEASPFYVISRPNSTGITQADLTFIQPGQGGYSSFELASGEGLAIRLVAVAAATTLSLTGMIEWDER